jgi:hypothetical protein
VRGKSGGLPGAGTAVRDGLRLIDFQFAALDAAIEGAARADRLKVVRAALLDQAHYAHAAKVQKAADLRLRDAVKKLIGILREDAAASESGGSAGASVEGTEPADVDAGDKAPAVSAPNPQPGPSQLSRDPAKRNRAELCARAGTAYREIWPSR